MRVRACTQTCGGGATDGVEVERQKPGAGLIELACPGWSIRIQLTGEDGGLILGLGLGVGAVDGRDGGRKAVGGYEGGGGVQVGEGAVDELSIQLG